VDARLLELAGLRELAVFDVGMGSILATSTPVRLSRALA